MESVEVCRKLYASRSRSLLPHPIFSIGHLDRCFRGNYRSRQILIGPADRTDGFRQLCNPYLGLQISSDMKWSTHINKVARKAQSTLGFLRRNLRHCTENCRKTAYIAMVRSVMEYGSTIWDPYQKGDIIKLERIQRKAIRFIKHDYRTREEGCINKMAAELGLTTLENRRKCFDCYYSTRWLRGWCPHYLLTNSLQNNDQGEPSNL